MTELMASYVYATWTSPKTYQVMEDTSNLSNASCSNSGSHVVVCILQLYRLNDACDNDLREKRVALLLESLN